MGTLETTCGNLRSVLGTPLQSHLHGNVYDPSLWAGHLSEVKTRNGRLRTLLLGDSVLVFYSLDLFSCRYPLCLASFRCSG